MNKVDWWESWLMKKLIDEKVDWWEIWNSIMKEWMMLTIEWNFLFSSASRNVIANKKKERKRNFVPANVGIFSIFLFFVNAVLFSTIYHEVDISKSISWTEKYPWIFQTKDYDISARALFWSFCCDITYCIVIPTVLLYGAPTIRRKWENIGIITYFREKLYYKATALI